MKKLLENKRVRWAFHAIVLVLGVVAMVLLVRHVGLAHLLEALRSCVYVLPLVFALEGVRIAADAFRTRLVYARADKVVSMRRLLPVQLAAYPITLLVPGGGAAAEAYKAVELADDVTPRVAAATANVNPALALFASAIVSVPCAIAAFLVWGMSGFTVAIMIQFAVALTLGGFILFGPRLAFIQAIVKRFSKRLAGKLEKYQITLAEVSVMPFRPLSVAVVSRLAQLAQFGALAIAVGAKGGLMTPLLALGVQLVGGAAGDMIPAQIGATDGAFALAAPALGLTAASALSIPIVMHAIQLAWALIGALTPSHKSAKKPEARPSQPILGVTPAERLSAS